MTDISPKLLSGGAGTGVFDSEAAHRLNEARLAHLASLDLPLGGRTVLEVGCGVGSLSGFFTARGCRVLATDARSENIAELRRRYPERASMVANVESDSLTSFGTHEVVFCYGLLYHLENPLAAIRNMASVCGDLLLLETLVCDSTAPIAQIVDEPAATVNQALTGLGTRPSPAWVAMALSRCGFRHVYAPRIPPDHEDFRYEWRDSLGYSSNGHPIRCIFVAARRPLMNDALVPLVETAGSSESTGPKLLRRRVWIDVGAHRGQKTLEAARRDPSLIVYAFEPNLRLHLACAGQVSNWIGLPYAIGESDGQAPFQRNRNDATSSLLPFDPRGLAAWKDRTGLEVDLIDTVPVMRLDTFLTAAELDEVEFLKIDAQGGDLAVVRSAGERIRAFRRITLEVQITEHPLYAGSNTKAEAIEYLTSRGFELESSELQSEDQEENLTFLRR